MKFIKRPLSQNQKFLDNYSDNSYTKLNENGYFRIWEHCQNGFFIISAFLNQEQLDELVALNVVEENNLDLYNKNATNSLKSDLRNLDYGFIEQKGYYGSAIPEISFFVPFNSFDDSVDSKAFDDAIGLMQVYHQESILIFDKYSDDSGVYYLYQNGDVEYAGEFHKIEDLNRYMSIIRGKNTGYTFESAGIKTMRGVGSLSPYYQYLNEGYIPIRQDFQKLIRNRFSKIRK